MAEYTGTFETGVDGNTIQTADSGSANAWNDRAFSGTDSTLTYSSTQKYQTLSLQMVQSATPGGCYVAWNSSTLGSSLTTHYGRFYYWTSGLPNTLARPLRGFDTGALAWDMLIFSDGHIEMRDQGGTTRATGAVAISTSQWVRIEWKVVNSATAGALDFKLFNNADSETPSETQTSSGSFSTRTKTDLLRFGEMLDSNASRTLYMDNILVNDTGYPGPFIVPGGGPGDNPPIGFLGRGAGW